MLRELRRISSANVSGHTLGSHTWSHADVTTLSWDELNDGQFTCALSSSGH